MQIALRLDDETAAKVDSARGLISRTAWIRDAIAIKLNTASWVAQQIDAANENRPGTRQVAEKPSPRIDEVAQARDTAARLASRRHSPKPSECVHPAGRRIGTLCAACGKDPA